MNSENTTVAPLPTSSFDDFLEKTSGEGNEADLAREAEEMKVVCVELEDAFPKTGLRFTEPFRGLMPVTAYGWILGQRFYFRFRADTASLTVGNVDPVKAEAEFERRVEMHARGEYQLARWTQDGSSENKVIEVDEITAEMRETVIDRYNLHIETDFSASAFPNEVSQRASIPDYTGNKWNGTLTPAEAKNVFSLLVEKLEK